jgi:hypothetical protein
MARPVRTAPAAVVARDAALRRLRRVRRALAAGTVLLAVALAVLASRGFSGHAAAATHVLTTPTKTHALRRTAANHRSTARPASSRKRHASGKRLSQPSAPPAAAHTTPGPTPPPAPVVTGGGS